MRIIKHMLGILAAVTLILANGSAAMVMAQAAAGSDLKLVSSDGQAVVLELTVDDFYTETVEHEGQMYHRLIIPGMAQTDTAGAPQVPVRSTMVGLPSAQGVAVQVVEASYETLMGYRLYPAPGLEVAGDNADDLLDESVRQVFALDKKVYDTDAFYPGEPVGIGHTGYMRDQAVAQVRFYPVHYNPVTGELRLYRRILAQVTWNALSTAGDGTRGASSAYENLMKNTILNYDALERPPIMDSAASPGGADIIATTITPTLKIGVTEDGVYQLNPSDLTGAGFELTGVALDTIKIENKGVENPIHVHDEDGNNAFNGNDYILFYGTAITDVYTTRNVYWLTAGGSPGQRMDRPDGTPTGGTVPAHFPVTLHAEEDSYYWQFMPNSAEQDHWFWASRFSAPEWREYSLSLNDISTTASTATVRIRLKGYTSVGSTDPDHHTKVYLNGVNVEPAGQWWDGQIVYDHEVIVNHSTLDEGNNVIRVEGVGDTGASVDQFFVNWIEIDYWDRYVAENDELLFGAPREESFQFEVTGFSSNVVDVFDVTDPASVAFITHTTVVADGGNYKLQFRDAALPETRYLALTPARYKSPDSIELDQPSSWRSGTQGADYIIVTHEEFYTQALTLASHRSDSGLRVATVKVQDVYDEFNYGILNPQAIRDFLSYAYYNWADPSPTYVLLVGDAYYDYHDNLNTGMVNYVPSYFIKDLFGQTVSDNWFVLVSGTDILPDMFIGRLAAQTAAEAEDMVDKIIYYEQNPPGDPWNKKVLLVADDGSAADGYTDAFEITSEQIADQLPDYYEANKVYVRNYPPGDPTTDITDYINGGHVLVNYAGHGNVKTWGAWASGIILNRYNVTTLNNTNKLPVVTLADCLNGYFVGTETSMAEAFLQSPNKRAAATWASTGLGFTSDHRLLLGALYEAFFQDEVYALGAATTAAKIQGGTDEAIEAFVLFGDPAMPLGVLTKPSELAISGPTTGVIQVDYAFEATVGSIRAGQPITYTWQATGQSPVTHTGGGLSDTITFNWNALGDKTVTVTATNAMGTVTQTHQVTILPIGVDIAGPTIGAINTIYTFDATTSPLAATLPITYVWQATGQATETRTGGGLNDTIGFNWSTPGTKAITVTATNVEGTATDTHFININVPLTSGDITGPVTGTVGIPYTFDVAVGPGTATLPITYVWQATDKAPVTHAGGGLSDAITFAWDTPGPKTITITATNVVGTVPDTHLITIHQSPGSTIYLPIVAKNN